jgi:hypothetical protein
LQVFAQKILFKIFIGENIIPESGGNPECPREFKYNGNTGKKIISKLKKLRIRKKRKMV